MPLIKRASDTDTTAPLARDSAWAEVSRRLKVLQKRLTAEESSENTISPLAGTARGRGNNAKSIGKLSEQMDKQAVILEFLTSAIDKQAAMLERIESREVERERAREKEKELLESRFVHHITAMSEKIEKLEQYVAETWNEVQTKLEGLGGASGPGWQPLSSLQERKTAWHLADKIERLEHHILGCEFHGGGCWQSAAKKGIAVNRGNKAESKGKDTVSRSSDLPRVSEYKFGVGLEQHENADQHHVDSDTAARCSASRTRFSPAPKPTPPPLPLPLNWLRIRSARGEETVLSGASQLEANKGDHERRDSPELRREQEYGAPQKCLPEPAVTEAANKPLGRGALESDRAVEADTAHDPAQKSSAGLCVSLPPGTEFMAHTPRSPPLSPLATAKLARSDDSRDRDVCTGNGDGLTANEACGDADWINSNQSL